MEPLRGKQRMNTPVCAYHRAAMVLVPADTRSRCPGCGALSHHVQFEQCRECGHRMVVELPEPRWACPLCTHEAGRAAARNRNAAQEDLSPTTVGADRDR